MGKVCHKKNTGEIECWSNGVLEYRGDEMNLGVFNSYSALRYDLPLQ